jgi:hypothetical protein
MYRSYPHPCFPRPERWDGCYPESPAVPRQLVCWVTGALGRTGPHPDAGGGSRGRGGKQRSRRGTGPSGGHQAS